MVSLHKIFYYIFFLWIVGVEQFFFTPFFIFIKFLYNKSIKITKPVSILLLILFFMITSSVNIQESIKMLQLLRNIYSFIGIIFIFSFFSENANTLFHKDSFLRMILWSSFIIVFCGFLPIVGLNINIETIFYPFFSNGFLKTFFYKTFADPNAGLFFLEGFVRPKGLMLYPNELSQICLISIGSIFYFLNNSSNRFSLRYLMPLLISIIVLISTLSRGSWVALTMSFVIIQIIDIILTKRLSFISILLIIFSTILLYLFNAVDVIFDRFLNGHSNEGRMLNYLTSLKITVSSPFQFFFGNGSQQDFPTYDNILVLGSHSTIFGIMFKYGMVALFSYFTFILYTTKSLINSFINNYVNKNEFYLLLYFILVFSIQSIFYELDVDMINMLFIFSIYGYIDAKSTKINKEF